MNIDPNHMFEDLRRESLSSFERSRIRETLRLFMQEHPAQAPLFARGLDALERVLGKASEPSYGRLAGAALALVLVVGVGTSYAAERALPGDSLYPIKIHLNEAVVGALAISDDAQAQWNAAQVSRRLEEAEELATQQRLTPIARAQIEMELNKSAHRFDASIAALKASDDEAAIAAAQTDLEASLDAHEQVLAALSEKVTQGTSLAPILATVRARSVAIALAQADTDAKVALATPAFAKAAAEEQQDDASDAVGRVEAALLSAPATLAATSDVQESAEADASIAKVALSAGERKMDQGDFNEAYSAFETAARAAKTAEVHLFMATTIESTSTATTTSATSTATSTATTTENLESGE